MWRQGGSYRLSKIRGWHGASFCTSGDLYIVFVLKVLVFVVGPTRRDITIPFHEPSCIIIIFQLFLRLLVCFACTEWNTLALRKGAYVAVGREHTDLHVCASRGIAVWV